MAHEYEYEKVMKEEDKELLRFKEAFLKAEDRAEAGDDYLDDMDEYITKNVPSLIKEGKLEEAWNIVIQGYSQLTDEDIENYDDNEMHESSMKWMKAVLSEVKDLGKKEEMLHLLIWLEKTEEFPCWVRSASGDLAHDLFTEPGFLNEIAEWYKAKYEEDPVENGAFWKGKLRDIAERLDSAEWKKVYEEMDQADPVFTDLVYAECIARRKDPRCLEIWNRVEEELGEIESEEDVSIIYSILWARLDWYDANGTDEEAQKACDALNEFVAVLHDDECSDDDCCCGHHHHDEEEEECGCGCGHHHHHDEEEECRCGHHHHDEDHECCCGNHGEN